MKKINEYFIEEKKSKFYSYLYSIDNIEEIDTLLNNIKKDNRKAKHICYSYIYNNYERLYSDKEPSGTTTGLLEALKRNNLNNHIIVVVRYFGGTLLGSGLLTRTYSKVSYGLINK